MFAPVACFPNLPGYEYLMQEPEGTQHFSGLPARLPVEEVTGFGAHDQHLTVQRYSDWALGEFFAEAEKKQWYRETLFVIVGDHGFPVRPQLSDVNLLRFHVTLLLHAPGIQEACGARRHTVGTQLDVVPTIVSLLGKPFVHQCWGRDLLSLPADDPGFGMIKPSGSDQTVALLKGDTLVVKPPNESAVTGSYALSPDNHFQPAADPDAATRPGEELAAFIQTAKQALLDNRVGISGTKK